MQILSEREVAVTDTDHLVVRKSVLDLGMDRVSGIQLTLESTADQPLEVEVVEEFPGFVSLTDVEVHPEYHPDRWSIEEGAGRMSYEDRLPPGGSVETIYGVRAVDDDLAPFLQEPSSVRSNPLEADTDPDGRPDRVGTATGDPEDATDGTTTPTSESMDERQPGQTEPARPTTDVAATHTPDESFQYGEDRESGGPQKEEAAATSADAGDQAGPPASGHEALAGLIEELARADLSAAQREALLEVLDSDHAAEDPVGFEAIRSALNELAAVVESFERLDDGPSPAAFEELAANQAELTERVETLAEQVEAAASERATLRDRLEALDEPDDARDADRTEQIRERLKTLEEEVREVDRTGTARFDSLADELFEQGQQQAARLDGLEEELSTFRAEIEERLEEIEGRLGELEAQFDGDELAAIQEVIAAERRWRDRAEAARVRRSTSAGASRRGR